MGVIRPFINEAAQLVKFVVRSRIPGTSEHVARTAEELLTKAPLDVFRKIGQDLRAVGQRAETTVETENVGDLQQYFAHVKTLWMNESRRDAVRAVLEDCRLALRTLWQRAAEMWNTPAANAVPRDTPTPG